MAISELAPSESQDFSVPSHVASELVPDPAIQVPDSVVVDYRQDIIPAEFGDSAKIHTDGVIMSDGSHFGVVRAVPSKPRTDVTIGLTTAWFTSVRGHNRRTVEHFARRGDPVVLLGGEGSYRPGEVDDERRPLVDTSDLFRGTSLIRSSHNYMQVLDVVGETEEIDTETQDMVLVGESRAAVDALGMLALAEGHDRNFLYADITAPPFPEGLRFAHIGNMLRQLIKEPFALAQAAGSLTTRRIVHYPETLDLHPDAIVHNLAMTRSLILTGEAGRLGEQVPINQHLHITTYRDDFASMHSVWGEIFAEHPNVNLTQVSGLHATIAHPITMQYLERRIDAIMKAVNEAGSTDPSNIDFSDVNSRQLG